MPHEGHEVPAADLGGDAPGSEEGRGASVEAKPKKRRSRSNLTGKEGRGRNLNLPDVIFERLQLVAIKRRKTMSAVAAELLDRHLPKLRISGEE
jgi:hypothetical protein